MRSYFVFFVSMIFSLLAEVEHKMIIDNSGNGITVFSEEDGQNIFRLNYVYTSDFGSTYSTKVRMTSEAVDELYPNILMDTNGNAVASWVAYDGSYYFIKVAYSGDYGVTWSNPINITTSDHNASQSKLVMDNSGHVTIIFSDDSTGGYRIKYSYSQDYGQTWSSVARISTNNEMECNPKIAINQSGKAICIWTADVGTYYRIKAAYSRDYGQTWTACTNDVSSDANAIDKFIHMDADGKAYVLWYEKDTANNEKIKQSSYTTYGGSWITTNTISLPLDSIPSDAQNGLSAYSRSYCFSNLDDLLNVGVQIEDSSDYGDNWNNPDLDDFESAPANTKRCGYLIDIWYASPEGNNRLETAYSSDEGSTWSSVVNDVPILLMPGTIEILMDASGYNISEIVFLQPMNKAITTKPLSITGQDSKKIKFSNIHKSYKIIYDIITPDATAQNISTKISYKYYSDDSCTILKATCSVISNVITFTSHQIDKVQLLYYIMDNQ